jgi:hypothetical protein
MDEAVAVWHGTSFRSLLKIGLLPSRKFPACRQGGAYRPRQGQGLLRFDLTHLGETYLGTSHAHFEQSLR